jgi:hypothetical protein
MGRFLIFEVRGSTRYVSGYQGLKPSLNLWIIHDHSTSRFGDFRFVMGVPPIAQATDAHDLVLKPMVTTGDPLGLSRKPSTFLGPYNQP